MFNTQAISSKLTLVSTVAIVAVSLLNVQTAFGYIVPGGNSYAVTPVVPRPGSPTPVRPTPTPRPRPRPMPIPYPGPVYPGPIYPSPGYPPPVNYTQYKTAYVNRWVYNENFYVDQLLGYGYGGYRLKNIRVDVSGDSAATVSLLVNGQLIETRYTSGQDVYLYPGYYGDYSSLRISVSGAAYIHNILFELERRY